MTLYQFLTDDYNAEKYADLTFDFLLKITNESERGAILIGGSKIDDYLEDLIKSIMLNKTKKYQNKLLKYPGPLSSFSGKIELLFAFRIIDERLYNSLNILRQIRNEAAHTYNEFSIQNIRNKLDVIYEFEEGFKDVSYKLAYKHLIRHKKETLRNGLEEKGLADKVDYEQLWSERIPDPENNKTIQEHLTIWKLAYGLVFLCLKIELITNEYKITTVPNTVYTP